MTFREGRAGLGRRLAFLLGLGAVCVLGQECKTFPSAGDGRRTVLFAEAFGDGAGAQLYVYALLSELRATHRYETYVSRRCRRVLSAVFTATSLSDVPVLEDAFCLENPEDAAGKLEPFAADAGRLVEGDAPLYGKALWLWPRAASSHEGQPFFQGYNPEEHAGVGHHRLVTDYKARLVRRLRFLEAAREKGDAVFRRVAATLELKPRDVTFVAVHHRRGDDFARWHKKRTGKGPIKKAYFYDAMEAMRESYDNVAFLYVSDAMAWGIKHLKNEAGDLFFVGEGDPDRPGPDLYLMAKSNHTVLSRGAFSAWGAFLCGGEMYTEYGSLVPQTLMDKIEEETSNEIRRKNNNAPPGSELFDMGEKLELFSSVASEETDDLGPVSAVESWIHYLFSLFF